MNPFVFERNAYALDTPHLPIQVHMYGSRLNDPVILLPGAWQDHAVFARTKAFETLTTSRYVIMPDLRGDPDRLLSSLLDELHTVLTFVFGENGETGLLGGAWRIIARGTEGQPDTIHWRRCTIYGASRLARIILDAYRKSFRFPPRTHLVLAQEELDLIDKTGEGLHAFAECLPAIRSGSSWEQAYSAIERYVAALHPGSPSAYEHALLCALRVPPRLSLALVNLLQDGLGEDIRSWEPAPSIIRADDWPSLCRVVYLSYETL